MNIRQVLGLPEVLEAKRVVCVQPHPDDNEVGAGGTIKTLTSKGCEVAYITVTDGRAGAGAGGTAVVADELVTTRRAERMHAGAILGVGVQEELGFPDGGDYAIEDVTARLVALFRRLKPEIVMTVDPWMPYEAHPDHIKTGLAVARALQFCNNAILFPPEDQPPCEIPQVAFYGTSYPNTWVEVTPYWETKMSSLLAHKSQFDNEEWPLLSMYFGYAAQELWRQYRKDPEATGYAEAFKVLATRQLHFFPTALYD